MSGVRGNRFKKLARQQHRVPKGERSGGEQGDSNPGRRGTKQRSTMAGKSVRERQGKRHRARTEWKRRGGRKRKGAELKMQPGREGLRDE